MIDVNDTGSRLVFGPRDWMQRMTVPRPPATGTVVWDASAGVVRLAGRAVRDAQSANPLQLSPEDRRGAVRDRFGTIYAISDDRTRITARHAGDGATANHWPAEDDTAGEPAAPGAFSPQAAVDGSDPEGLAGLAITTRDYLIAGTRAPAGLLVFDLVGGGPPEHLPWPSDIPFFPIDIAPRPGGGLWILDVSPTNAYAPRLWTLDRAFRVVSATAAPASPDPTFRPASAPPTGPLDDESNGGGRLSVELSEELAYDLDAANGRPVAIEAAPDDTLLVAWHDAAGPTSHVQRLQPLSARDPERGEVDLSGLLDAYWDADEWTVYDIAFDTERAAPRPVLGTLYAVGRDGRRALGFDLRLRSDDVQAAVRDDYLPFRRFSGGGLLSTSDGALYDAGDRWLPVAVQPRRRYVSEGIVRTRLPLDGDEPGVTWHRVFLDACIPTSCSVQVESRSADTEEQLRAEPWQAEPALYQRPAGSEIPYDDPFGPDAPDGAGTWEVLLQQAEGRYLDLRLTLRGNGRGTPRIQSLRAYAPRFSYLKEYLPDVYQQDPTSADFLERFLANPEGMFTALEGRIASAQVLFDTRTVPDDYLDWLGTWLGAEFDAAWEPERRRLFLDHAMDLYRRRGTVSGLLTLIDLALHPCPDATVFDRLTAPSAGDLRSTSGRTGVRVVETFRTRTQTALRLGDARQDQQPGLTSRGSGWTPSDGAGALTARFRAFLNSRYETPRQRSVVWPGMVPFPAVLPEDPARRGDWRAFVDREIAVPYAEVDPGDAATLRRFRQFLARSTSASDRRAVYGTDAVDRIPLPGTLPAGSRAYDNWMQFVSFVLPMQRQAHRFTVLVPSQPDEAPEAQQRRVNRVRRIVQQHRPAHTDADVQPFWALFRVGYVRVPYDTVLGESSRYAALVLGTTDLADGTLAAAHPFGVSNRRVTDRDAASSSTPL